MSQGYISLHRSIRDNFLWKDKPFSRGQAWVDLLLLANHKDNFIFYDGKKVKIKRGQHITTERDLASSWGWSRSKVRRFLELLKGELMIERKSDHKATHLTVCNYNEFQTSTTTEKPQKDQGKTTDEPQANLNNNDKKVNNENNIYISIPLADKTNYDLTEGEKTELEFLYPYTNVEQGLKDIKGWNLVNVNKRKTRRGILKHINSWLRSQNEKNLPQPEDKKEIILCRGCNRPLSGNVIDNMHSKCYDKI